MLVMVKTWMVRRAGGLLDGTIWVPEDATADDAKAEARREHGANAQAVRRPGDPCWAEISPAF